MDVKRWKEMAMFHEQPVWNEDCSDGQFVHYKSNFPANPDYYAAIKKEMVDGKIKPFEYKREFCNRCGKVKPVPGMCWCGRCAIKHNLRLRFEDDPNLIAIRANIRLFKKLLKLTTSTPAQKPTADESGDHGFAELLEVYEESQEEFMG